MGGISLYDCKPFIAEQLSIPLSHWFH